MGRQKGLCGCKQSKTEMWSKRARKPTWPKRYKPLHEDAKDVELRCGARVVKHEEMEMPIWNRVREADLYQKRREGRH